MNITNMKKLRSQLARLRPEQFDMGEWACHPEDIEDRRLEEPQLAERVERCGTVACIAGWAALLNGGPKDYEIKSWAIEWLDLDRMTASNLFYGHWADKEHDSLSDITLDEAIEQLDKMISRAEQKEEVT